MNFKNLEKLMRHFVDEGYAPGNTVQVYSEGKKVFDFSCGVSDIETGRKMTGDEYFNFYSCSKMVTVCAALQLVEKGILSLSDPLYDYIPEYREMYVKTENGPVRAKNDIKILNLFNMTAGLDYNMDSDAMKKAAQMTSGAMHTDVVTRCLAGETLSFEPGERFQYSLCHDVLAGLVSIVTGKKFRDYVKENIFLPLGMNTAVYHATEQTRKNMASQYRFVPEGSTEFDYIAAQGYGTGKDGRYVNVGIENGLVPGPEYDSGGAGIISDVSDFAKFAAALANHGLGLTGERILCPETVELMRTNTLTEHQRITFDWPQLAGYGYGLGVRTLIDKEKSGSAGNPGEFGWGGAAGTSVYVDPDINLAAVYAKHTLFPREEYYQPRVRDALYSCL